LGFIASALSPLNQTVAIQHRVYGAFRRRRHHRESAQQLLADLGGTPTRILSAQPDDCALNLERYLVGVPIGAAAAV
jgi:hypothetical protein